MNRKFRLVALLILAMAPTQLFAQRAQLTELVVHLDISESIRKHLADGRVASIQVIGSWGPILETKSDTVTFENVPPGTHTVRTMVVINQKNYRKAYVVEPPRGREFEIAAVSRADITVPIPDLVFVGRVTLRGQPFRGQMSMWPWERGKDKWGFAAPLDADGRFALLLPRAGKWQVTARASDRKLTTGMPVYEFREIDALREMEIQLPEGSISGSVIDSTGKSLRGVLVQATRQHGSDRRITATALTDENGQFTLDALATGRWSIHASHQGRVGEPIELDLPPNSHRVSISLAMPKSNEAVAKAK